MPRSFRKFVRTRYFSIKDAVVILKFCSNPDSHLQKYLKKKLRSPKSSQFDCSKAMLTSATSGFDTIQEIFHISITLFFILKRVQFHLERIACPVTQTVSLIMNGSTH